MAAASRPPRRHNGHGIVGMTCPHCGWPASVRSSTMMSNLTRQSTHYCTNPACGHTFVVLSEIVRTLSLPADPNPNVQLPLSHHVQRAALHAMLDKAPADTASDPTPPRLMSAVKAVRSPPVAHATDLERYWRTPAPGTHPRGAAAKKERAPPMS